MSRFPELRTSEELSGCLLCCWDKLLPWSCPTSIEQPCETGPWGMFWGQEMLLLIPGGWCAGLIPDWTICRLWTCPDTWHANLALKHLRELWDSVVGEKQGCRWPWVNCLATRLALLETGDWEILDSCSRTGGPSGFVWAGFEEPLGARGLRKNMRLLDLYLSWGPLSWERSLNNGAPPSENESGEQNGLMNSNLSRAGKCPLSWEQDINGCKRPGLKDWLPE